MLREPNDRDLVGFDEWQIVLHLTPPSLSDVNGSCDIYVASFNSAIGSSAENITRLRDRTQ